MTTPTLSPAAANEIRDLANADHPSVVEFLRDLVRIASRGVAWTYDPVLGLVGSWLADHGFAWRYLHDERGELVGLVCDVGCPGPDHVVVGCRGFLRAAITVTGTAGHSGSSTPVSGNAVEKAAELVHRLVRTKLPTVTPKAFPLPPKLTVTALHGGEASGGYTTRRVRRAGAGGAGAAPWPVRVALGGAGRGGGPGGVGAGDPGGVRGAAERLGVDKATLYLAWRRWGLGRPTDRPEGARATAARKLAAARRADRAQHPWRQDRSIWQPQRAAGGERGNG